MLEYNSLNYKIGRRSKEVRTIDCLSDVHLSADKYYKLGCDSLILTNPMGRRTEPKHVKINNYN
jgi:hypothetical protein